MKAKATASTIKRLDNKIIKQEHIISYDFDNAYPQRCEDIVNDSRSAKSCLRLRQLFLSGGGFKDKEFAKKVINRKGLTANKLLRQIVNDSFSKYESICLHVNYNALYEITEINFIPWSNFRFCNSEEIKYKDKGAVYKDWARVKKKSIKESDISFYDFYNPTPEIIQFQVDALTEYDKDGKTILVDGWVKYKGQLIVLTPVEGEYPLAFFDTVLEDMQTEGKMKRFRFRTVDRNFMASHLLITGKQEDDKEAELFQANIESFQGDEEAGNILWLEKESPEDGIELKKVEMQDYDGAWEITEKSCIDSIIDVFLIPPVLKQVSNNPFSDQKQIEVATAFYNGLTDLERTTLSELFEEIGRHWHEPFNVSGDFSIGKYSFPKAESQITAEYFPYYTADEIRSANGDSPLIIEGTKQNTKTLSEILGVGGTQSLLAILQDVVLTYEQKLGTLQVLFNFDLETAIKVLGDKLQAPSNLM